MVQKLQMFSREKEICFLYKISHLRLTTKPENQLNILVHKSLSFYFNVTLKSANVYSKYATWKCMGNTISSKNCETKFIKKYIFRIIQQVYKKTLNLELNLIYF